MPYGFSFSSAGFFGLPSTRVRMVPSSFLAWSRRRLCSSGMGSGFDQSEFSSFLSGRGPRGDDADGFRAERIDDSEEASFVIPGRDFVADFAFLALLLEEGWSFLDDGAFRFVEADSFFFPVPLVFRAVPFDCIGHSSSCGYFR
jgi:hypothetical protein